MPSIKEFYKAFMFGTVGKIQHVPSNSFEHNNYRCFPQCLISLQKLIKILLRCFSKILFSVGIIANLLFFTGVQDDMMISLYWARVHRPSYTQAHAKFESS